MEAIKLVAADMDGTLLNSQHELNPDFFGLFNQMKASGILFAAASGRQYHNIYNRFEGIQDEMVFIAENGSYVVYQGVELLVQAMEREVAMKQVLAARAIDNTFTILCGKKCAYIENEQPDFMKQLQMYYDKYQVVEDLLQVENDQFLKIAICDFVGSEKNCYQHFKDKKEELQVKVSGSIWLDISHQMANKGRAINIVQEKFGISIQETMVFGDYLNDLEMMQQASYSYAMENAHPEIKKAARFLAKTNDDNGVCIVLEQMLAKQKHKLVEGN
jgi:Cof subfamily protein (haloacid dehalogenase superfamily)